MLNDSEQIIIYRAGVSFCFSVKDTGSISVYTSDHPLSANLATSAHTSLLQMPSPSASTVQPAQTFETDETRPDSSAGGSSQHTQPKDDGPVDSDISQVKPVVKPSRMTLEEAERILDKKWKDYLVDEEIYLYKDEVSPGVVWYGITHLAKPWMDYKDSWDGLVEYWGNQCDDWWQQGDKEKAALAVCIMYSVKSQQELERRKEECEKTFRTVYKYAQGRG
jgi:hypothetical protein